MKSLKFISMAGRDIAGYHHNLHKGFDGLDTENYFFYERTHPFYTHKKKRLPLEKIATYLNDIIVKKENNFLKKLFLFIILYPYVFFFKILLFPYFIKKYDVFIFSANYSFIGFYIDRIILKFLNKKIIDITLGSEARPPYLNKASYSLSLQELKQRTKSLEKRITRKIKYSSFLIDHPGTSHFNTRPYIPLLYMGLPTFIDTRHNVKKNKKPLIIHAPSNPEIKGTDLIRETISDLKNKYNFDYEELMNVPHEIVLSRIKQCDFVINQLYTDTLMSTLDAEAAWFSKPSIVGGYGLKYIKSTINGTDIPPTYCVEPTKESLKKAIIQLITDPAYCQALGKEAQKFVKAHWSAKSVAQKYVDMVNGKIPESIMRSPYEDSYINGFGMQNNTRQKKIASFLEKYGPDALCINSKPSLKLSILKDCGLLKQ